MFAPVISRLPPPTFDTSTFIVLATVASTSPKFKDSGDVFTAGVVGTSPKDNLILAL